MTQALNLANFANNVNSSGQVTTSGVIGGATYPIAVPVVSTTNFTITEVGGKLVFKYLGNPIASLDSSGDFVASSNVTAYGTP